jgi:hypothetical protein
MSATDIHKAVEEAKLLVGAIQARDAKTTDSYVWRLADLSAANTPTRGGRPGQNSVGAVLTVEEWAEEIGWLDQGNTVNYLKQLIAEARAWSPELRVTSRYGRSVNGKRGRLIERGRTIEQHRDARAAHATVEEASAWLHSLAGKTNIRDRARSIDEITGSGPVYDATLKLIRARKEIMGVPAKLAGSGILGNEANFPQFRRELKRVKNAVAYLDRYLADETVVDPDEMDRELARLLGEGEA